jgi:hypothetical protein
MKDVYTKETKITKKFDSATIHCASDLEVGRKFKSELSVSFSRVAPPSKIVAVVTKN